MQRLTGIEERIAKLQQQQARAEPDIVEDFKRRFDMSWIYHDSILEGVVYTQQELRAAIDKQVVSDSSLLPAYEEIRAHKDTIEVIRELAQKKKITFSIDLIRKIHNTLLTEKEQEKEKVASAGGKNGPVYRKEMPIHRLYFHEIAQPDKIPLRLRQVVDTLNDPKERQDLHVVQFASDVHFEILQIYPFTKDSGKLARLIMNLLIMQEGFPPIVIHSTDRQRYYDGLRLSKEATLNVIIEALLVSIDSGIRFFDEYFASRSGVRVHSA